MSTRQSEAARLAQEATRWRAEPLPLCVTRFVVRHTEAPVRVLNRGLFKTVFDLGDGRVARVFETCDGRPLEQSQHPDHISAPEELLVSETHVIADWTIEIMPLVGRAKSTDADHLRAIFWTRGLHWVDAKAANMGILPVGKGRLVFFDGWLRAANRDFARAYALSQRDNREPLGVVAVDAGNPDAPRGFRYTRSHGWQRDDSVLVVFTTPTEAASVFAAHCSAPDRMGLKKVAGLRSLA